MTLLAAIEAAGFTVAMDTGKLTVSPASKLTAAQREKIKANRDRIIGELRRRESEALDQAALSRPPPLSAVGWVWTEADEDAACRPMPANGSAGSGQPAASGGLYAGR